MEKSINISRSIMLYIVQLLAVQYIVNRQEQSTNLYLFIYIRFTSSLCCILYIIKVLALNTTESKLYSSYSSMLLLLLMGSTHNNITNNSKHKTQRVYNTLIYKDIYTPLTMKRSYIYISLLFLLSILLYLGQKTEDLSCLCTTSNEKFYSMMGYTSVIPIILYNCSVWASAIRKKRVVASLKAAQRPFALVVGRLFQSTSTDAALVLANIVPLHLRVVEIVTKRLISTYDNLLPPSSRLRGRYSRYNSIFLQSCRHLSASSY